MPVLKAEKSWYLQAAKEENGHDISAGVALPYPDPAPVLMRALPDIYHAMNRYYTLLEANKKQSRGGPRMHVVVNKGLLTPAQWAVQASHAVAEYMDKFYRMGKVKRWVRTHKTMILLAGGEMDIQRVARTMKRNGHTFSIFREPDLGGVVTAVACEPMTKNQGLGCFMGLNLL